MIRNANTISADREIEYKDRLSEWKLAVFGLSVSLCIIAGKLYFMHSQEIHDIFYETNLYKYEYLAENGQLMFKNVFEESFKYSPLLWPLLCGLLATYITWTIVYLDSEVPGVHPPSPLSPSRIRRVSGHTFHLNYVFAVVIGVLVSAYMYAGSITVS